MLTITRAEGSKEREERYGRDVLFPSKEERPFRYNKPHILISCRVHAGESPASYIMKGMLEWLLNDVDASTFLDHYVIVLIPMLNPDGVYRGH
jgi:murein tripeptide amidase MpaA